MILLAWFNFNPSMDNYSCNRVWMKLFVSHIHYDGRTSRGKPGLQYPLCMAQCTPDNNGWVSHLYYRGFGMQVYSLHSGANDV